MPIQNVNDWSRAVLTQLGIKPTQASMQAMVGWAKAEGGHWHNQARFNPLNTTQPEPGAGNTGSQGNIKVYRDWNQGVKATVDTLRNGRYGTILDALRGNNPMAVASAIGRTPWGTGGGLVQRTIAAQSGQKLPTGSLDVGAGGGSSPVAQAAQSTTTTTPGVDNRVARAQLIQSFLDDRKSDPIAFAQQAVALRDVAPTSTTTSTPSSASVQQSADSAGASAVLPKGSSPLFELIHNTGSGPGYAVKNGQKVNGPQFYSSVWAGHANHVHVAAGPKTIVDLGKLAERMGLHVGENPHFGGVTPVHVPGSYHYKGEAIDVSGDPNKMNAYARAVERTYGIR